MRTTTATLGIATICLISLYGASPVYAGGHESLEPGALVRITLTEPHTGSILQPKRVCGNLVGLNETDIALLRAPGDEPSVYPWENVEKLELNTRQGRRKHGTLVGLGLGAATGLLYGLVVVGDTRDDPNDWSDSTALETGAFYSVLFAPVGALIGVLVSPGARWQSVDVGGVSFGGVTLSNGGVGLNVALGF